MYFLSLYGYYSNVVRGKRQQEGIDDAIPCILEPQGNEKAFRKNWARLIQKIYEVDPLVCPKCRGPMSIISSSKTRSDQDHLNLGLWLVIKTNTPDWLPPPVEYVMDGFLNCQ